MHVTAIIAAAGTGQRVGAGVPKQLLDVGGRTILERSVAAFVQHPRVQDVIVVLSARLLAGRPGLLLNPKVRLVEGGARRQDSVANGFEAVAVTSDVVLIHDAARPFVTAAAISQAIDAAAAHGAAIVAQPVRDTVKRVTRRGGEIHVVETLPRDSIFLAQTPQAFRRTVLQDAVTLGRRGRAATDEAALAEMAGHTVRIVEGRADNMKITTADDLAAARRHTSDAPSAEAARAGIAYDLHRLVPGRRLVLGGVAIPSEFGALGHSDADVVCHAATDALLGAACLGDIGRHFPDTDPRWKDADSLELLRQAVALVRQAGYRTVNVDVVVILERPKIAPFLDSIREKLAAVLEVDAGAVSVKGKTNEGMDAVGRGEAVAAHAIALLARNS